uniref:aminoglycoside 6-adenylyltransferase n=2 Tax=Streptococcus TaxID=1301 RepID=UPI002ED77EB6
QYLPAEKEKNFSKLLAFSDQKNLIKSFLDTMDFFHKEAQDFSLKTGFHYDKETAEAMIEYAEERLETNETFTK